MTPKHWFKMVGSAMVIFVIGLALTSALNAGAHRVKTELSHLEVVETNFSDIDVPVEGMDFKLNETTLGKIQKLSIKRASAATIEEMNFVVELEKGISADQFANCEVTLDNPAKFDKSTRFHCLRHSDAGYGELVRFGTITFKSPGMSDQFHRFEIPASLHEKLMAATITAEAQSGANGMVIDQSGNGHLQIKANGRSIVDISGDENGGRVLITDPATGKAIVDINGSNAGGVVRITDPATGKAIIEIMGTEAGGSVKVDGKVVPSKTTVQVKSTGTP